MKKIFEQFKYLADRNLYGRSRLYIWSKAFKLMFLYLLYKNSNKTIIVTCWKCEEKYKALYKTVLFYDNTKCGNCYL